MVVLFVQCSFLLGERVQLLACLVVCCIVVVCAPVCLPACFFVVCLDLLGLHVCACPIWLVVCMLDVSDSCARLLVCMFAWLFAASFGLFGLCV